MLLFQDIEPGTKFVLYNTSTKDPRHNKLLIKLQTQLSDKNGNVVNAIFSDNGCPASIYDTQKVKDFIL